MDMCLLFFFGDGNQKGGKMLGSGGKSSKSWKCDHLLFLDDIVCSIAGITLYESLLVLVQLLIWWELLWCVICCIY
jgi:hypothetical protein